MSSNLDLTQIAASQANKYAASNTADAEIDAALTEVLAVEVDDTNAATLTNEQFRRAFFVVLSEDLPPPDAAITLTVPAIPRGLFTVINGTGQEVTVEASGQSETSPTVAAGEAALFSCDGSDVRAAGSAGGGGGGTDPNAIHTNVAGEIAGLTEKTTPVSGDHLVIEDSAAGNAKKRVQIGNLPSGTRPYDFGFVKADTPASDEVIGKVVVPRAMTLPADFSGAAGHVDTSPTAPFDIDVTNDGASIGTISISTAGALTFSTASGTSKSVAAGSVIRFVAPTTTDATVAGIAATLAGTIT